ncbi:MAG TPA: hypothetical protein ENG35_07015 [Desulfobacteraceae bacterium]|nr:hypothetical protein [Desulfobacteraceae bacterium]
MKTYLFHLNSGHIIPVECDTYHKNKETGLYEFYVNDEKLSHPEIRIESVDAIEEKADSIEGVLID